MQAAQGIRGFSARLRRTSNRRGWLLFVMAVALAWWAGSAVARGGTPGFLAIGLGGALFVGTIASAIARGRLKRDFVAVELPALLIMMGELVLRQRDADALASNPLDPAGMYRVLCIGSALLLGGLALTSRVDPSEERITSRPFRLYCLYVLVVFIAVPLSIKPLFTAYRAVELAAGVVAVAGACRRVGREGAERILSLIFWFTVASAIPIWIGAMIMPGSAFSHVNSPFPIQLSGVWPPVSANGTGLIGAVISLWSLAKLLSPQDRGDIGSRTLRILAVLGFVTLLLAQYRTGYIAYTVGLLVLLGVRARTTALWVIIGAILIAFGWGGQILQEATPILQRGATVETVEGLSGRLNYWSAALPVWRESPLFGRGLLTASRFEVLAKLGVTSTSTIHSTWVEALVGTGLVGVALLASSFLITLARAFKDALRPAGRIVPLLLMTIFVVRSITGTTFEVAGSSSLLLLSIALLMRDPARARSPEQAHDLIPRDVGS